MFYICTQTKRIFMIKIFLNLRKMVAIAIFLAGSVTMFAQDIITLKSGIDIKAVIHEVGTNEVKYQRFDNLNGSIYTLRKSEIFRIVYENGTIDVFSESVTPTTTEVQEQTIQYSRPVNHPTAQQVIIPQPQNNDNDESIQRSQSAQSEIRTESEARTIMAFGAFIGGGALVGGAIETMLSPGRVSLYAGAGLPVYSLPSFSLGFNYHFKPRINSSFVSFHYNHLGFGGNFLASTLGPGITFRAKKVFQAGIEFGYVVARDNRLREDINTLINFQIGLYFPL
jgi:hypothetical protein